MSKLLLFILSILLLVGCGADNFLDRRDFNLPDDNNKQAASVRLDVDWLSAFGTKPSGLSVMAFSDGGQRVSNASNTVDSMDLRLSAGSWRMLLFNLTPGEFGSMSFSSLDSYDDVKVSLNQLAESSAKAWAQDNNFLRQPEEFALTTDSMNIAADLTAKDCDTIVNQGTKTVYVYRENPHTIATTLTVNVKVKGIENARTVEGSIDGMARGYFLTQRHADTSAGTFLLDDWKGKVDDAKDSIGHITTSITTFGLPYHEGEDITRRDSMANVLTLYFLLRDGKTTCVFHYPVGNNFRYVKKENGRDVETTEQTLSLDITIDGADFPHLPNVITDNNASGFNAEVDPWQDGGSTEVTF